ncbi:MAG: DUF4307 domain-containing protein [Microbacteriaceae bacterium]
MTADLDLRYGRTRGKRRRDRWIAWTVAAACVAGFSGWTIWVGLGSANSSLSATDIGFHVLDRYQVRVTYTVSMPPGTTARCALQAQNADHAIVGWKIVPVPASTGWNQSVSQLVKTSELAVTGLIYRCWVT